MITWPGGIFRSDDLGETWTHVFTNRHAWSVAVDAHDARIVNAGANNAPFHDGSTADGVHVSRDGCQTWRPHNNGLGALNLTALLPNPVNPGGIYAATGENGLFRGTPRFE